MNLVYRKYFNCEATVRVIVLSFLLLGFFVSADENWPMPSGPDGNWTVNTSQSVPQSFSVTTGKNILWKSKLPEGGQSGIAVWGEKIFLTIMKPAKDEEKSSLEGTDIVALCVNALDGKILWRHAMSGVAKSKYMFCFSDSSSPGPVTDGEKVWFTNASGKVSCLDYSGKLLWERAFKPVEDLDKVHFPFNKQFEPFMYGDTLVSMEPYWEKDGKRKYGWNYLFGLDKNTGKVLWISEDALTHYNTPFSSNGKVLIGRGSYHKVPESPLGYSMIDLKNGKRIWKYDANIGKAMYNNSFSDKYALWFTEEQGELHVLNPVDGKLIKKIDLTKNVNLRTFNGKSYDLKKVVDVQKELGVKVFPAWYSNLFLGDNLFFMCFTGKRKSKYGPNYCMGKVNIVSGKIEYLQVPVHNNPAGEPVWNKPLETETRNSRGLDVAYDKRSKRDGWYWAFNGSPICINNKIYFTTMIGTVYCIDTQTSDFNEDALISVNDLGPLGKTWSVNSLSYANGKLYHRTLKNLICIGKK